MKMKLKEEEKKKMESCKYLVMIVNEDDEIKGEVKYTLKEEGKL